MTPAERQLQLKKERELGVLLLKEYAGQWVAVRGHELVDSADTAEQLYGKLAEETTPYRSFRVKRKSGFALLGFRVS